TLSRTRPFVPPEELHFGPQARARPGSRHLDPRGRPQPTPIEVNEPMPDLMRQTSSVETKPAEQHATIPIDEPARRHQQQHAEIESAVSAESAAEEPCETGAARAEPHRDVRFRRDGDPRPVERGGATSESRSRRSGSTPATWKTITGARHEARARLSGV